MIKSLNKSFFRVIFTQCQKLHTVSNLATQFYIWDTADLTFKGKRNFTNPDDKLKNLQQTVRSGLVFKELLEKGKNLMLKGDYQGAEKTFQEALELSLKLFGETGPFVGVCHYSMGHISTLKGDKRKGREYYLKAYDILSKDPTKHKDYLLNIERALSRLGLDLKTKTRDLKETKQKLEEELRQLLAEGNQIENAFRIGNIYNSLGALSQQESNLEEAIQFKQKALEHFEKSLNTEPSSLFFVYLDLAIFYRDIRHYQEAMRNMQKSLKLIENDNTEKAEGFRFIAYHNLAKIYIVQKEYERALEPLLKALQIKEFSSIRDEIVIRSLYHEIGMVYFFLKNSKQSIHYFEKALDMQQRAGDESFIAKLYQHIGECYLFLESDFANSKKYFERALNLRKVYQGPDHEETKALEKLITSIERVPSKE